MRWPGVGVTKEQCRRPSFADAGDLAGMLVLTHIWGFRHAASDSNLMH